ncbi:MAG: periplasmic heavy metal sensor, partial [Desulfamplus sp.]|nr:periplasmic heavy metal sensor [Desulfamplus sp.]
MKKQYCHMKGINIRKHLFITMTTVLFAMVAIFGNSFAGDVAGKKGAGMENMTAGTEVQNHQNVGKLTDEQKSQLKALHQKFIDETATQRAAIIAKHQEIRILMETSSPDKEKLHAL